MADAMRGDERDRVQMTCVDAVLRMPCAPGLRVGPFQKSLVAEDGRRCMYRSQALALRTVLMISDQVRDPVWFVGGRSRRACVNQASAWHTRDENMFMTRTVVCRTSRFFFS